MHPITLPVAEVHEEVAQLLFRRNPVRRVGVSWGAFNWGGATESSPNCYAYAVGHPYGHLEPGELARGRSDVLATAPVISSAMQLDYFRLDGLIDLTPAMLGAFPNNAWVLSIHQSSERDFHVRRLDAHGWSEKPGSYGVRGFQPARWQDLCHAEDYASKAYDFSGFFIATSLLTLPRPPLT